MTSGCSLTIKAYCASSSTIDALVCSYFTQAFQSCAIGSDFVTCAFIAEDVVQNFVGAVDALAKGTYLAIPVSDVQYTWFKQFGCTSAPRLVEEACPCVVPYIAPASGYFFSMCMFTVWIESPIAYPIDAILSLSLLAVCAFLMFTIDFCSE